MSTHSENLTVECAENCGNSPKKKFLKELTIAFAKNDTALCLDWLTDDVVWEMIGDTLMQGKSDVEKALTKMNNRKVQHLHIRNIITHGNTCSVNGTLILNDDKQKIEFCDVYQFRGFSKNAKIKVITSYVIKTT